MAITAPPNGGTGGKAPVAERPDPKAASTTGSDTDRGGFDLGGASDRDAHQDPDAAPAGSTIIPGGSKNPVPASSDHGAGASASGMSQGSAQATGGPAGGAKPGEATQPTAGAVRPPQSAGADQSFTQGNPDDAG